MDVVVADTYGRIRLFLQRPHVSGTPMLFDSPIDLEGAMKVRLTVRHIDWDGDGWEDLIYGYGNGEIYVSLNRPGSGGTRRFDKPKQIKIPGNWGDAFISIADWNKDGDDDIVIQQYGYSRYIERSFAQRGYSQAKLLAHELRNQTTSAGESKP